MAEASSFSELVNEAFIKPLRSVLIVDDQYPTWEEIFNSQVVQDQKNESIEVRSVNKKWRSEETSTEIFRLVDRFRRQNPGFIIDIHDGVSSKPSEKSAGSETPQQLADHLHQSDLLVLDYNLEGAEAGTGGEIARRILSSVLTNQHFNLVVIHTSEQLDDAMHECLLSLMTSCTSTFGEECVVQIDRLDDLIQLKEDEGSFSRKDVSEKIDLATYVNARTSEGGLNTRSLGKFMQGRDEYSELSTWAEVLDLNPRDKRIFFYWAIREFEKKYSSLLDTSSVSSLTWRNEGDCKWLRTSRGFVTFVEKGPDDLLDELQKALENWQPTPSRLLSAKYRHEISRVGANVEDASLQHRHAFAKFYETILHPGGENLQEEQLRLLRGQKLREHVSRQSEMLSFLIEDQVIAFGNRIFEADCKAGFSFKKHYGVDLSEEKQNILARSQYNRYVSCLPSKRIEADEVFDEQLDSGHIFMLDDAWWVCATPACDLQPGQNTIAFTKGNDATLRPFTALKLHKAPNLDDVTDRHINSGSYCYVDFEGDVICLGTKTPADDTKKPGEAKVIWRSFVAQDGGIIRNGKLNLFEVQLEVLNGQLKSESKEAQIITKLRYEYALNFIQRIGGSVSRIGLGYVT